MSKSRYKVNSSNPGKIEEFRRYLNAEIEVIDKDLPEPDADPLSIVCYKASQFQDVLVDDTSLWVEGAEFGTHVRWKIDQLAHHSGSKAKFVCLLGIRRQDDVYIYRGEVAGRICKKTGEGFGFNPYFVPEGSLYSLALRMEDRFNARYLAVQNFLKNQPYKLMEALETWAGGFQEK